MKKIFTYILFSLSLIFLISCGNINASQKVPNNITNKSKLEDSENNNDNKIIDNINEKNLTYDDLFKDNDLTFIDYSNFKDLDMNKDDIKLKINKQNFNFSLPIYLNKNRYYFPLNEFIHNLKGKLTKNKNLLYINVDNNFYSINLSDNNVKCPNKEFILKKSLLSSNNIYYICFSDLSHMLNLYTRWDKDNKIINCKMNFDKDLKNTTNNISFNTYNKNLLKHTNSMKISTDNLINTYNKILLQNKINIDNEHKQIGLIRFEDVCLTSQNYDKNYFENLRIIGTYMNEENIPYHIAWIPRYKNPNFKIDNDPLTKNNFEIAEMIYSLDYLKNNNGSIGLHGYTHQIGDNESAAGFEFGKYEPSVTVFKEKLEKAIETAKYLDVPIDFFEVPHYEITPNQNKIAEKYFKILYHPFNDYGANKADLTKPQLSPYNNTSLYISTPLDYIAEGMEEQSLDRIKNANPSNMGSVFFHPSLENNFIKLNEDSDGSPSYTYDDNSTLKRLVNILKGKKYKMIKVTEL